MELNYSSVTNITIDKTKAKSCQISNWILADQESNKQPLLSVIITIGALSLIGIIGNGLVFYVYARKPQKTTNRVFILALSVLDFLSCIIVIPFEIYDMTHSYNFTLVPLCKIARFSEFLLILSAGSTLVAISLDRYIHLCRYKSRFALTASRAKKVCAFGVVISIMFSSPILRFAGIEKIDLIVEGTNLTACGCTSFRDKRERAGKIYMYILMITFVGALLTMLISYVCIGITLFGRRIGTTQNGLTFITAVEETKTLNKQSNQHKDMNKKESFAIGKSSINLSVTTVIFFTVTLVFVLGFLPQLCVRILRLLHVTFTGDNSENLLYNFLVRSYLINSVSNPFIYSIIHKRFRDELVKTIKEVLCCRKDSIKVALPRTRSTTTLSESSFT